MVIINGDLQIEPSTMRKKVDKVIDEFGLYTSRVDK